MCVRKTSYMVYQSDSSIAILPPLWSDLVGDGGLAGGLFERIRLVASLGSAGLRLLERESILASLGRGGELDRVLDRPRGGGEIGRLPYPRPYPPRLRGECRYAPPRPLPPR